MTPVYATVKIDETFAGDGVINFQIYIEEILKLADPQPTMMIEHLNQAQLVSALKSLFGVADKMGVVFDGSSKRIPYEQMETDGEYFAPHEE